MKKMASILFGVLLFLSVSIVSNATVIQMNAGTYVTPENFSVNAEWGTINLDHHNYYEWSLPDLSGDPSGLISVNIVFHGIYNSFPEDNLLSLYIRDSASQLNPSWQEGVDFNSPTAPNWTVLGYAFIDSWTDVPGGGALRWDVVFQVNDPGLLANLMNGGSFVLGIDPDCHFLGERITIESAVPEPSALLLLGTGLIGLGYFGRRKIRG